MRGPHKGGTSVYEDLGGGGGVGVEGVEGGMRQIIVVKGRENEGTRGTKGIWTEGKGFEVKNKE